MSKRVDIWVLTKIHSTNINHITDTTTNKEEALALITSWVYDKIKLEESCTIKVRTPRCGVSEFTLSTNWVEVEDE